MESEKIKKYLTIGISVFIGITVLIGVLTMTGVLNYAFLKKIFKIDVDSDMMTVRNAYDVTLLKARQWQEDAVLARITSLKGETGPNGRADDWDLMFVSRKMKGIGFHIVIENKLITVAEELPFVGNGGELPENVISSKEAISRMRQAKGYEDEQVLSVEMIYSPDGKLYWGIKTPKGVATIKAQQ